MNIGKRNSLLKIFLSSALLIIAKRRDKMDLQLKVREYLLQYGIKKKYLASMLGIYPSQLSQWLSGDYHLNENQIKIVEDFLNGKLLQ